MTDKISKYEVVERIAEGGFGVVYKARDPYLKRTVAVKTCSFEDDESRQRFFREAQLAARFDHPNVTRIHDFGVEDDQAFLVQEYLSGEDLLPKIQRLDRIPLHSKLEYLLQAARGLRYAHGRGVIHRDIKPGNIRVLENGEVKILDFGIAKPLGGSALTQQGMTVGTLGYLSPEQIEGKELDKRTDIFSFGVVAYELIAYTSPFSGKDVRGMLRSILGDAPQRLDDLVPDCPEEVADIVHRCLRRDPDDRYDDFESLLRELELANRAIDPALIATTSSLPTSPIADSDTKPAQITTADDVLTAEPTPSPPPPPAPEAPTPAAEASEPALSEEVSKSDDPASPEPAPEPDPVPASEPTPPRPEPAQPWSPPPPLQIPPSPSRTALAAVRAPEAPPASDPPGEPVAARPPVPPETASGTSMDKRLLLGVGAVAGLLLILALVWWLARDSENPVPEPVPVATPVVEPEPLATEPTTAPVLVVASPWATIADVLDASGESVATDAKGQTTPRRVDLPLGFYSIILQHPAVPEVAVCQVIAAPGVPATCQAQLVDVDVTGYFKETGWWD